MSVKEQYEKNNFTQVMKMDMGAFVDKEFYKKSFSLIKVAQMISPTDIILITLTDELVYFFIIIE